MGLQDFKYIDWEEVDEKSMLVRLAFTPLMSVILPDELQVSPNINFLEADWSTAGEEASRLYFHFTIVRIDGYPMDEDDACAWGESIDENMREYLTNIFGDNYIFEGGWCAMVLQSMGSAKEIEFEYDIIKLAD